MNRQADRHTYDNASCPSQECLYLLTYLLTIGHTSVDIGASANLELLDKFCYLGGRLSVALVLFKILALYKSFTYLLTDAAAASVSKQVSK